MTAQQPTDRMRGVSRRTLLKGGLAAAAGLAVSGGWKRAVAAPPSLPGGVGGVDTLTRALLPTPGSIYRDYETMVNFGARITASTAHNDYISWMKQEFEAAGCYERSVIDYPEKLWMPKKWSLKILSGPEAGEVPVASFRGRAGGFNPDGSAHDAPYTGKLLYLGKAPAPSYSGDALDTIDLATALQNYTPVFQEWLNAQVAAQGEAADGAIVIIEVNGPAPLDQAAIMAATGCYFSQSPTVAGGDAWAAHRPWKKLWLLSDSSPIQSPGTGPVAAIFIVDASYDALVGQFLPWSGSATSLPGLLLDREAGARVRRSAGSAVKPVAELTMSASNLPTTTPSIVYKLAGTEEEKLRGSSNDLDDALASQVEYVVVNTHSDGMSIAEENGCLALVNMARYFGELKRRGKGIRRTLVFSAVTGHMGANSFPQTGGFLSNHPKIRDRIAFGMTPEHVGGIEWVDDTRGFYPTGYPEPAVMYHNPGLTPLVFDSFINRPLGNHGLSAETGVYFGIGGALADVAPSVSYIAGPTYLCQIGRDFSKGGLLNQLSPEFCRTQYEWFADILTRFESLPFRGNGVFAPSP